MSELPEEYPYQTWGVEKVVHRNGKAGVIAPPGSGKTRIVVNSLDRLNRLRDEFFFGPIIVICSGAAINQWVRQIPLWGDINPEDIYVVTGRASKRGMLWYDAHSMCRGVYICNFAIYLRDWELINDVTWGGIVADEYHKVMRGHKLKKGPKHTTLGRFLTMTRHMECVIPTTGSVIRKNPASMWSIFRMMEPSLKTFRSYWRFAETYCHMTEGYFGREIIGPKNVEGLKKIMDQYLCYIPREVVADQLPNGNRIPVHVSMTNKQAKVYSTLKTQMVAEIGDTFIISATILGQLIQLRKILCCPRMLSPSLDMGGGFELIIDRLEDEPHAIIFVPFRDACDVIKEELHAKGYKHVGIMRGQIGQEEQDRVLEEFKEHDGIIVGTIAYGESWDAETCNTSYFLGYEYALDMNEQAEGRTQRAISEHLLVTWNYIQYSGTIDDHFLGELNVDLHNVKKVLSRPDLLIKALRGT